MVKVKRRETRKTCGPTTSVGRLRSYVMANISEPEALRIVGEESVKNGTDRMSSRKINQIIQSVRAERRRPR